MNFRLTLYIAFSIICGLITSYFFIFSSKTIAIILLFIFSVLNIVLAVFGFINKTKLKTTIFCILSIILFVISLFSFSIIINNYDDANLSGHTFNVTAKVTEIENTSSGQKAVLSKVQLKGYVNGKTNYKILLYVYGSSNLDIGNLVKFSASIDDLYSLKDEEFSASNIQRKIKYSISINSEDISVTGNSLTIFERANLFIRDTLKKGLNESEFELAYAMLTGNSEYMDGNTLTQYRAVGIAHIFAVSGLHIGFVCVALKFLLDKLRVNKYIKTCLIILSLIFYSGICGFSASSIRATIMCSVALISSITFRKYDSLSALSLSAIIILLISPMELFCAGFQLSFSVVLGITMLSSKIEKLFKFLPRKVASSLGAVISAQLASIPVSIGNFGNFSTISLLANILFIPIVGIIFIALILCTLLGGILTIPQIVLFPLQYILFAINWLIGLIDYRFFLISGVFLGGFSLCYYFTLFVLSGIINFKKVTKIIVCSLFSLAFILGTIYINIDDYKSIKVSAAGSEYLSATLIQSSGENCVIISNYQKNKGIYSLNNLLYKNGVAQIDYLLLPQCDTYYEPYSLIGLINYTYNIKNVVYFGEQDTSLESAVKATLPSISIYSKLVQEEMTICKSTLSFINNGYFVEILNKKFSALICSTADEISISESGNYTYLVCQNNMEYLFSRIEAENKISYLPYGKYEDCQTYGFLQFVI